MAITRTKKEEVIAKLNELFAESKLVVVANYAGLTVKDMQQLKREARDAGVTTGVAKNRLVKIALKSSDSMKELSTDMLTGQVMIASSSEDEVAPAQVLANFAKEHDALEIIGAFSADGLMDQAQVKVLSDLPSKDVLIAQVVATLASPMDGVLGGLAGGIPGILSGLSANAETSV